MQISEALFMALNQLKANKMRSFLTLLGIIVGIAAVIALMAVGNGAVEMISGQFSAAGTNMVFIQWDYGNENNDDLVPQLLQDKDLAAIRAGGDLASNVVPYNQTASEVRAGRETLAVTITGINEGFLELQGLKLARGRFFNSFEVTSAKSVCVLGWDLHDKLFKNSDGLGKTIRLRGKKFLVIGIMEEKDDRSFVNTGLTDNMRLYIPYKTLQRMWNVKGYPVIMAQPIDITITKALVGQIKWIIARIYGPKNNFLVQSMEQILEQTLSRMQIFSIFLAGLGGISLLVGGIGIMNIMLVSAKERTQEIGVRKALGAKRKQILLQFLIEAIVLCLIGGFLGIALGFLIAVGIKATNLIPAAVSLSSVLLAVGCSLAIGLFFGIYPAWKAAQLDPIESLRYE